MLQHIRDLVSSRMVMKQSSFTVEGDEMIIKVGSRNIMVCGKVNESVLK